MAFLVKAPMPHSCGDCPMAHYTASKVFRCSITHEDIPDSYIVKSNSRPKGCPVRRTITDLKEDEINGLD